METRLRPSSSRRACVGGFTLLEIMLVVMIIALLAGVAIVNMGTVIEDASVTTAQTQIRQFQTALISYRGKAGWFPTTEQGLSALVEKPTSEPVPRNWSNLMQTLPKDPWGMEYRYVSPGQHNPGSYDVYSVGKDRKPGTEDDIGNWENK